MALTKADKAAIVKKHGKSAVDTGSTSAQIALLTEQIKILTEHMLVHKKDNITKRGLFMKVAQRKKLMRYLEGKDIEQARALSKELNIRR